MSIEWLRWYHGTTTDPKFTVIARKAQQPRASVIALWAGLLEYASQASPRGSLNGIDPDILAASLDMDEDAIQAILAMMELKGLTKNGAITEWDKRQVYREDDSRERVRRYRNSNLVTHGNAPVTQGNASVTPQSRAEEEADTEQNRADQSRAEEEDARAAAAGDTPLNGKPKRHISADWQPSQEGIQILRQQGITEDFARSCLPEFKLYWTERGDERHGWDACFINSVKRSWEQRPRETHPTGRRRAKTIVARMMEDHSQILNRDEPDPFADNPKPTEGERHVH